MIPAPPGAYTVEIKRTRNDGSSYYVDREVVAFDDDGDPLVVDPDGASYTGLVRPPGRWRLEPSVRLHAPIPAEPGWHALFVRHDLDESELYRYPVIAWHGSPRAYGGSATVVGWDDEQALPFDAVERAAGPVSNLDLIGFFHPERFPEPADLEQLVAAARRGYVEGEWRRAVAVEEESPAA